MVYIKGAEVITLLALHLQESREGGKTKTVLDNPKFASS